MRRLDSLGLLETFVRIVERGSISAAARDLGSSQPTLSRQLVELEERVGAQLLRRTTHDLHLTAAGKLCLEEARVLLGHWDSLLERCGEEQTTVKGSLTVVAPVVLGQTELVQLLADFLAQNPEISVNWILTDEPISFSEVGCDVWFKVGEVNEPTAVVTELQEIERILVASPQLLKYRTAPERPQDLEQWPFLALAPFEGRKIPLRHGKEHRELTLARTVISSNNLPALKTAVLCGAGFAVMPRWLIENELANGLLVELLPGWRAPNLSFNLAYRPLERQPLRLTRFLEFVIGRYNKKL